VVQQGLFPLSGMFQSWGVGAGGMSSTSQEDFPIRQVVPVGLGFSFWVCLGVVLDGGKCVYGLLH
jgi:hypothetical protein